MEAVWIAFGNLKSLALRCFDSFFFFQILHSYGSPALASSRHKGSFTADCFYFSFLILKTVKAVIPPMVNLFPNNIKTPQPFSAFSLRGHRSSLRRRELICSLWASDLKKDTLEKDNFHFEPFLSTVVPASHRITGCWSWNEPGRALGGSPRPLWTR